MPLPGQSSCHEAGHERLVVSVLRELSTFQKVPELFEAKVTGEEFSIIGVGPGSGTYHRRRPGTSAGPGSPSAPGWLWHVLCWNLCSGKLAQMGGSWSMT